MAIAHAHRVLDWQENLPSDEVPPSWMWPFEDELEIWFDQVEEKREDKYGRKSGGDETVPLMSNELAKGRRG